MAPAPVAPIVMRKLLFILTLLLAARPAFCEASESHELELLLSGGVTRAFDLDGDDRRDEVQLGACSIHIDLAGSREDVWLEVPGRERFATLIVTDLDGDADVDLALADVDASSGRRRVWINDGSSQFASQDEAPPESTCRNAHRSSPSARDAVLPVPVRRCSGPFLAACRRTANEGCGVPGRLGTSRPATTLTLHLVASAAARAPPLHRNG